MKHTIKSVALVLVVALLVAVMACGVSMGLFASADETQYDLYRDHGWYLLTLSNDVATFTINTDLKELSSIRPSDLSDLKADIYALIDALDFEGMIMDFYTTAGAGEIPDDVDLSNIDLDNIDMGKVQDFFEHYFTGEEAKDKIDSVLSGSYDAFIKQKIAEKTEYTYEEISAKLNDVATELIKEVYADEPERGEEIVAKMENKVTNLVEQVEKAGGEVEITIEDMLNAIIAFKINGKAVYQTGSFKKDAIVSLIKSLPRPAEIANMDELKLSYDVAVVTDFGTREFTLVLQVIGHEGRIRQAARLFDEHVTMSYDEHSLYVDAVMPKLTAKAIAKVLNSDRVPQRIRDKYMDVQSESPQDWVDLVNEMTLQDWIDTAKELDFNSIFANLGNAEAMVSHLCDYVDIARFTKENVEKVVGRLLDLANNYTTDDVQDFIVRYLKVDPTNYSLYNKAKAKVDSLLQRIDFAHMDVDLLYHYLDFERYADRDLDVYFDKLARYADYYTKLVGYVNRAYNHVPDAYRNLTLLDLYQGEGEFAWADSYYFDYEKIFTRISKSKGPWIATFFEEDGFDFAWDLHLTVPDLVKVSYYVQDELQVEGLLAKGVDVAKFARPEDVDGYDVLYWVDEEGNRVDEVPDHDVKLYAVKEIEYDVTLETEGELDKAFDGEEIVFTVVDDYASYADWTYEWYFLAEGSEEGDFVLLEGETQATLTISHRDQSGRYFAIALASDPYDPTYQVARQTEEVEVSLHKIYVDCKDARWDYENPFSYDATEKQVKVIVPDYDFIIFEYVDNKGTDAGVYVASAVPSVDEEHAEDYEIINYTLGDLEWKILPAHVDVSDIEWTYDPDEPFTYNGNERGVSLDFIDEVELFGLDTLNVQYAGVTRAKDAGTYTAKATLQANPNYVFDGWTVGDLEWKINPFVLDEFDLEWNYERDYLWDVTYNGNEWVMWLYGVPSFIPVEYTGNKATDAGDYRAQASAPASSNYDASCLSDMDLYWEILKADIPADLSWLVTEDTAAGYTFENGVLTVKAGQEYGLAIGGLPTGLSATITYQGDHSYLAGTYQVSAAITGADRNHNNPSIGAAKVVVEAVEIDLNEVIEGFELVEGVYSATYDQQQHSYNVSVADPAEWLTYTMAWYDGEDKVKDEVAFTWVDVASQNYTLVVRANKGELVISEIKKPLSFVLNPFKPDVSTVAWNYTVPYTYNGQEQKVELNALPVLIGNDEVTVSYLGNKATAVGSYTASFEASASDNYDLSDLALLGDIEWKIEPLTVDVSAVDWEMVGFLVYDGTEKSVGLEFLDSVTLIGDDTLPLTYSGDLKATDAGVYVAKVSLGTSDNYIFEGWDVDDLEWSIAKAQYDLSGAHWNQNDVTIIEEDAYNPFELLGLPAGVTAKVLYNGQEASELPTEVGVYLISAELTQEDTANYEIASFDETRTLTIEEKIIPPDVLILTLSSSGNISVDAFDGVARTITITPSINLDREVTYTYEWSKDGRQINTNGATLTVRNVTDNGTYLVVVTAVAGDLSDTASLSVEVRIRPLDLDMGRANWNYVIDRSSFVYDGLAHQVEIVNLPQLIGDDKWEDFLTYSGTVSADDVGNYTASFAISGMENYIYGNHIDRNLAWSIRKGDYDLSGASWHYSHVVVEEESGETFEFTIDDLPEGVRMVGVEYFDAHDRKVLEPTLVGEYKVRPVLASDDPAHYNPPVWTKAPALLTIKRGKDIVEYEDEEGQLVVVVSRPGGLNANHFKVEHIFQLPKTLDFSALNEGNAHLVAVYQITTSDTINPNDQYEIKIFVPEVARRSDLHPVYINDQGKVEVLNGTMDADGYMVFKTNHFSIYGVATSDQKEAMPIWFWILIAIIIVLVVIIVCLILALARKKKKDNDEDGDPKEETAKDEVQEQAKEEVPVEEAQEEPAQEEAPQEESAQEEVPEETAEEPQEEAPVAAALVADEAEEEEEDEGENNVFINPETRMREFKDRSMQARLIQADPVVLARYTALKNAALSYKKIGDRQAWGYETFNRGRAPVMRVRIRNKTVFAYFALDPNEVAAKYHAKDESEHSKYAKVPTKVKIKSDRALKYALQLLDEAMEKAQAVKGLEHNETYSFEYETDEALIEKGLIKIKQK